MLKRSFVLLARTALLAGDRTKAIELLGEVLRMPSFYSPDWLRIDPSWETVRGDPGFKKLIAGR